MQVTPAIAVLALDEDQRVRHPAALFGVSFPMCLEPVIYTMAGRLSPDYTGGLWAMYALSNGAFYMAPESKESMRMVSPNGFEGTMSADALGITACLYAYSHLSFGGPEAFAEICTRQYHLLREFMFEHAEAGAILRAID
jgi:hypothetical protein